MSAFKICPNDEGGVFDETFDKAVNPIHSKARRFSSLVYKNGEAVLPPELLKKLQEYIEGDLLYIPKKNKTRAAWGAKNGTRTIIQKRNSEIYEQYKNGCTVEELIACYHLSEDSIRKIIRTLRKDSTL